jgi:outer membrane receptor protein involved in Fe transport
LRQRAEMVFRRLMKSLLLGLAFLLSLVGGASAQLSTATMFGNVVDSTGAVIPNATVTLTQKTTNFVRTTTSNARGEYRAEFLPVGPYTVKVSAAGFRDLVQSGIVLTATQEANINLPLQIGSDNSVVEVTAEVPLVNLGSSVLGKTVDNREVDNLPIVGRNVYQLLSLTPGVQAAGPPENTVGFPAQHVIINGSSDNMVGQVTYYLDGGINMTGLRNTGNVLPNPDAIDQFAVQTSNFSAEYGRTGAGIVTVLTKSGTNQMHGSVFEFHQETNFNSNAWLQTTRTPQHINRFGGTLGGPIWKNKTFFFGSYAGLRQISPVNFNTVVPDQLQRAGNFSENLPGPGKSPTAFGGQFQVYDPITHKPVAGNRLDLDPNYQPDPVAAAVLAKNVPLPTPGRTDNRFIGNEGLPNQTDEFLIKVEHQLAAAHRLTVSYYQSNGAQENLPSGSNLPGWAVNNYNYRQQNANVSDIWTISPRSVNQIWLSYTRMMGGRISNPGTSLAAYGSDLNVQGTPSLPDINVANFFHLANAISGPIAGDNVYGLRDVYNTTKGRHSLSIGGEVYLEKDRLETLLNNYGTFSFTSTTVPTTASSLATYNKTGAAISDFLIGHPNSMGQDSPDDANANYWNYGFFAQDDFRPLPTLTLNLGLRYDVQTAPTDTQRRYAVFRPGVQSTVSPNAMLGQLFPGDPGVPQGGVDTNYNHFSPRVGFAYDPYNNGHTVFHGGTGLFFNSIAGNEWMLSQNFQPFAVRETAAFSHVTSLQHIYSTDCQDFAGCTSPFPYLYSKTNPRYVSPASLVFLQEGMRWPYNVQVNFGMQQQLAKDLAVSINYAGAFSRKLPLYIDENDPIYNTDNPALNTTTNYNCRRPFDAIPFGTGTSCANPAINSKYMSNGYVIEDGQNTNYNGLQISVDKRLSNHISVSGFYIWAKALASASLQTQGNIGNSNATIPEDYRMMSLERQRTDNDIRNQFVASGVWKPDYFGGFNPVVRTLLDGWSISAIVTLRSGLPFTTTSGTDDNMDGNTNDRPNVAVGKRENVLSTGRNRSVSRLQWFDTTAYCKVASTGCPAGAGAGDRDGTVRANSLDGPGYRNVDAAIFRDFTIYERVKFQFRGEATNVFNMVNMGQPAATLNNTGTFGVISGQATNTNMRVIQLGGRILF